MERVRNRKAHVALLLGHLELHLETSSTRQVPNSCAGDGHKGAVTDRGNCQASAGGGERVAHHHRGCRVSLTAIAETACFYSPSPNYSASFCHRIQRRSSAHTHRTLPDAQAGGSHGA